MAKRLDICEQLRRAIQERPETLYSIAKGADVNWSVVARFVTDSIDERRDIRMETAAKLATYLKLQLASF
jgi:hypothetical protein